MGNCLETQNTGKNNNNTNNFHEISYSGVPNGQSNRLTNPAASSSGQMNNNNNNNPSNQRTNNPYGNSQFINKQKSPHKIDFDNLGKDFVFLDDAKRMFDQSPWQRDEGNISASNKPSKLEFGNSREPIANGYQIKRVNYEHNDNNNISYQGYVVPNCPIHLNASRIRLPEKGYPLSSTEKNRKKQTIFYESSTYNVDPYVKVPVNQYADQAGYFSQKRQHNPAPSIFA